LRWLRVSDRETAVGPAQLSALSVLVFGGAQSLAQLARVEQVKPPTMSRIVNGLVEAGLAKSTTDARDRRGIVIRATEKGNRLMHAARQRRVATLARALQGMSKREIGELKKTAALMESLRQKF
jgi:DNA-binding MarR family transcriptional regulator